MARSPAGDASDESESDGIWAALPRRRRFVFYCSTYKWERGKGRERVSGRVTSILEYRPATGFLLSSLTHNLTVSLPNPFYPAQSMPSGSNSTQHIHSQIDTYIMQSNSRLKRVSRITHSLQQNHKKSHNNHIAPSG